MTPHVARRFVRGSGLVLALLLVLAGAESRADEDAGPLTPGEVLERWQRSLDGRRFTADVTLRLRRGGDDEQRVLRVYRDDSALEGERVMIRFEAPPDLRSLRFLYVEQSDRGNDYYLYQADLNRLRRLHESVAAQDLYGIDFEFLGFGGVPPLPVEVVSMRRDRVRGREAYVVRERARAPHGRFEEREIWIDARSFVGLRTEHLVGGERVLVADTEQTRSAFGVEFPVRIRFERPRGAVRVDLEVTALDFTTPIPQDVFSVMALSRRGRR